MCFGSSGIGCKILWMHLIQLNCTPKMVKMAKKNFMCVYIYTYYHNLEFFKNFKFCFFL